MGTATDTVETIDLTGAELELVTPPRELALAGALACVGAMVPLMRELGDHLATLVDTL